MNYKKIFKTTRSRMAVLKLFSFLPDEVMLPLQYRIKLARKLNLKSPARFTEKLQWYKINYRNPIMHQCVDKYLVREYVSSKGLSDILIPIIGHYGSVSEVNWESLPNQFVIKTTHGGGGLNVVVCYNKMSISQADIFEKLTFDNGPVSENSGGREWAYYGLNPGIIVEELLINQDNPMAGVNDYKIFCYNGKAKYIIVDIDRYIGHKRNFYDREWNNLYVTSDCPASEKEISRPVNLEKMLEIAEILSKGFPYVRVDLYNLKGKIYFGELTFYPWSGYVQFMPDDWDYKFGEDFRLKKFM